ncbi:MAG: superfamily I DNA/RNA helicase [Acidobacteria bacterium OLB17]|nr:MAG: superfamily I DNA/RNA helicase [Acidobacteria bacterium OLB17]
MGILPDAVAVSSPEIDLLAKMGDEHEKKVLAGYREKREVRDLSAAGNFEECYAETKLAVEQRAEVLYQAALRGAGFEGYADFITLGDDNVYQIWDTKLARTPRPYFILQLCAYTEMFAETTGELPSRNFGIILGPPKKEGQKPERVEFAFEDFRHYYENLKARFFQLHDNFTGDISTRPEPELAEDHGIWQEYVDEMLRERDHLCFVAGITRGQIEKLHESGVQTLGELAEFKGSIANMPAATVEKLSSQARLQRATQKLRETDVNAPPLYELLPKAADGTTQGLYALPKPSPNDVFFDMEGFPFNGGLEYLFGNTIRGKNGELEFVDFWAHDRAQEKKAFEAFIDWVYARWQDDDSLHIYHYAHYEKEAVSNLMTRHDTRAREVDELLRNNVFVDLYRIVKRGVRIGEESYSLKKVEHLYNVIRGENVASAVDSVVQYASWIESGEPGDWRKSKILADIREYNRVDCESTAGLYDWLHATANANGIKYTAPQRPDEPQEEKAESAEVVRRKSEVISALRSGGESDPVGSTLGDLVGYHRREMKPRWWHFFDLIGKPAEELRDEPDCIAEVEAVGDPRPEKKSLAQGYKFDISQECKLSDGGGSTVCFQHDSNTNFSLISLDHATGDMELKASQGTLDSSAFGGKFPAAGSLVEKPDDISSSLAAALLVIGENYLSGTLPAPMQAFLSRKPPIDAVQRDGERAVDAAIRIAEKMDGDCLVIQGPPGTGKTYTAARMILSLLKNGKRVGVTSNSHKAILNLQKECLIAAKELGESIDVLKVGGDTDDELSKRFPNLTFENSSSKGMAMWLDGGGRSLLGGTAWLFARNEWADNDGRDRLDFLFVDEAGQVSIANAVSVLRSTKNLVLLGDQMQLEQPMQGKHPGDSGLSALQYALKDVSESNDNVAVIHPVVPDGHGLFLGESRRMHPDVCEFISESIYEGRLTAFPDCAQQQIAVDDHSLIRKPHGIVFSPVIHDGDTQSSEDEADRVVEIFNELLGREYTNSAGKASKLALNDFLFITPYNAQVIRLTKRLPKGARIGSVDRLQGQQAPVCIVSLCSSVGEYGSRGLAFILDRNRVNVAISRAQCLAIVVADPRIAHESAGSVNEMKLLNLFCKIAKQ